MLGNLLSTDKLRLAADAVVSLDVVVAYMDADMENPPVAQTDTSGAQPTAKNSADTTDILASPAASHLRAIKNVNIRNKHATLTVVVTVIWDRSGTGYELKKETLLPGDELTWTEGLGWNVFRSTSKLNVLLRVLSDVVNATTSFADITGLTHPLKSGKFYRIMAGLIHANDASSTGSRFGYNIGAAPTIAMLGTIDTVTPAVITSVHSAGVITARDTAITAQTTGSTANRLAHITGFIQPSADGTFAMRSASEVAVANGLTIRAGSWLGLREFDN